VQLTGLIKRSGSMSKDNVIKLPVKAKDLGEESLGDTLVYTCGCGSQYFVLTGEYVDCAQCAEKLSYTELYDSFVPYL
jgi:hypothetical protein